MDPVTTDNYATIAKRDEVEATESQETTPALSRAARIALAVERSRTEYQPQHAYTERGWLQSTNQGNGAAIYKADRHHFEYLITSLYYAVPPDYRRALKLILEALDPYRPLGGLSREIIDIGTRCALACQDVDSAVKLARVGNLNWRPPFVGLAESAADAFLAAGLSQDALRPLLLASAGGVFQPISKRLAHIIHDRPEPSIQSFHSILLRHSEPVDIDRLASDLQLDSDLVDPLRETVKRLQKGTTEELKERSVRDL